MTCQSEVQQTAMFFCLLSIGCIQSAKQIPLDKIAAVGIPGTQDIVLLAHGEPNESISESKLEIESLKNRIQRCLETQNNKKERQAFIVRGHGMAALRAAKSVLCDGKPSTEQVGIGELCSIVFFTQTINAPLLIDDVSMAKNKIDIWYDYDTERTPPGKRRIEISDTRTVFALIPIKQTNLGETQVRIRRRPGRDYPPPATDSRVSSSFAFQSIGVNNVEDQ